jgi:hypothetical protein
MEKSKWTTTSMIEPSTMMDAAFPFLSEIPPNTGVKSNALKGSKAGMTPANELET